MRRLQTLPGVQIDLCQVAMAARAASQSEGMGVLLLLLAQGLSCSNCHGSSGPGRVAAPLCQSCHTGTALRNSGQIRFSSASEPDGGVRHAADSTFGVSDGTRYTLATGHGGLQCEVCHGEPHYEPHMKLVAGCADCHDVPPNTTDGGPHGLHPVGEPWVKAHGLVVDETGVATCLPCHGKDRRGTALSRTLSDRDFKTSYGEKRFPRGTEIGCYSCHADNKRVN